MNHARVALVLAMPIVTMVIAKGGHGGFIGRADQRCKAVTPIS